MLFMLGLFIGAALGVLTLSVCTSGKTEDLYTELAREKEFSVTLIKENQRLASEVERAWGKDQKGSDQG